MSHFSVTVCLGDEDGALARAAAVQANGFRPTYVGDESSLRRIVEARLEPVLAPYDENLEVTPYRDYEEGGPEEYWLYRSLKRAVEDEANGTGIKPYNPGMIGWSTAESKETPDEQRMKIAKEAALFRTLPEPVTWDSLRDVYGLLYPGEEDDFPEIDENDRAYKMSTYNPDSKWDYWRVGGRWGGNFTCRPESALEVIGTEKGWDSPGDIPLLRCDGGRKGALDLAAMREDAAEAARKTYREYHSIVDSLPEARPWSAFWARLEDGSGYTIDQARADYRSQPRVQAMDGTDFRWHDDTVAEFSGDIALHAEKARAGAVPGFATVTLDGKWMAPGRMGWFAATDATDSTRIGYWEAANAYIDSLPDDAWLVVIDCLI